ncbi:MAG: RNase adapter RapZ [Oscillospiraceae bacterium]|jgi:UPF0042 nucleotide-binding protein
MDFVITTGLSGAGKSRAIDALEDIGFYCVDNMPPSLIPKFADLCYQSGGKVNRVAIVTDIRGGDFFEDFFQELDYMKSKEVKYKILFLDASDTVLINRYKETRRRHPLTDMFNGSVELAIKAERKILMPVRERADYVVDTSLLTAQQLKQKIMGIFSTSNTEGMLIDCMSFGFKYGVPAEADLVFDVRCLPNPFYIDELKLKTGLDKDVRDYVMQSEKSVELLAKLTDLVDFLLPMYRDEGKSHLVIAVGCTGGKHRSVTFAENIYKHLSSMGLRTTVNHRDITK